MKKDIMEIKTGLKYWRGELASSPILGNFRPSKKEDVFDIEGDLSATAARRYERLAVSSIARGEGIFSILAAGASSRMNVRQAPPGVRHLASRKILSKAAVPIGVVNGKPQTYLALFGSNLSRLLHDVYKEAVRAGYEPRVDQNQFLIFSNSQYLKEHREILKREYFFGLDERQVRFLLQPLGPKFWAAPEDVRRLSGKVPESALRKMLANAKKIESQIRKNPNAVLVSGEREPLGHGEFFHQLIASGEILEWVSSGKKWVLIRNVDNCAAKLDRVWLWILGRFLDNGLDFQVEVSPRSAGQTGGSLIIMKESLGHQIAEDPSILATNRSRGHVMNPEESYWLNDAVALCSPRYILSLYKDRSQSDQEFIKELQSASRGAREEIAEGGRARFPSLLDVKPAKTRIGATVKRETNLWQSTGLVPEEIRVKAVGVRGARHLARESFLQKSFPEKMRDLSYLRFLSTKQWFLAGQELKSAQINLEKGMGRKLSRREALLLLETYEGNKALFADIIRYVRQAELVRRGILKNHGA